MSLQNVAEWGWWVWTTSYAESTEMTSLIVDGSMPMAVSGAFTQWVVSSVHWSSAVAPNQSRTPASTEVCS
jgi:hypothetical protein